MHQKNNFDFLRLLFALFVIITHSYPLTGLKEWDWLSEITNGQLLFSYIGVKGFFIISGYLIYQSLERSNSLTEYYWKRALRLFPALLMVLVLTVIMAPFVYEGTLISYVSNESTWTYILYNLTLYKLQFQINGIFENNPYQSVINGSLWTIEYEFTMYFILSFLFYIKGKKRLINSLLIVTLLLFLFGNIFYAEKLKVYAFVISMSYLFDLGFFFFAGSLLAAIKIEKFNRFNLLGISSAILLVFSLYLNLFEFTRYFVLPFSILWIGINSTPFLNNIGNRIGDLSYGIYIYGFPVQQTLVYYFKPDHVVLMILSIIISAFFAYFSWNYIELIALKYKKENLIENQLFKLF